MSRLDLAAARLRTALDALDGGLDARAAILDDRTRLQTRIAELEAERERLLARMASLEEENAALQSVTGEVEERLDGAIGEIRAALARA